MPRYGGYDDDLELDDGQLPEGCLQMSKLRSIARGIKRQALAEASGMGSTARKRHKAKAIALRRAIQERMAREKAVADAKKENDARSVGIGLPVEEATRISNVNVA
jgi:hypothetical protein